MDQIKIGKFIADRRKINKLTQKDLSDKLGVSNRSVSKWETGKCMPDVSLFSALCDILEIDVNELLAGEKLGKDSKEKNKEVISYIEYSKKKDRLKFLIISLIFAFLVTIIILGTYFLNNFNKTTMYKLYAESENFSYSNGLLIVSNYKNVFSSGKVTPLKDELKNAQILSVTLKSDNHTIVSGNMFLEGAGLVQEDYGYNEILDKEKIDNMDNWYLEIIYVLNNNLEVEKLDVKNEVITTNNRFLIFKVTKIDEDENKESNKTSSKYVDGDFDYDISLMHYLEEKGYTHNTDSYFWLEKNIRKYVGETGEGVSIDPFWPRIMYRNKIDNKNYYSINWTFMNTQRIKSASFVVEGEFDGKSYSYTFNVEEDSVKCFEGVCPGSAWEDAKKFLYDFDDIINFDVE